MPKRVARAVSLLAIAGLAGCGDGLTVPTQHPAPAPRLAATGAEFQYSIPTAPTSYKSEVPWTNTGIVVPRTGKYRLRVQGMITSTVNPAYPGTCDGGSPPEAEDLGVWGPVGKNPEFGISSELRVRIFTQAVSSSHPGFNYNVVDAATVETEQQLSAGTTVWVARNHLSGYVYCGEGTETGMYSLSGSQVLTVTEIPDAVLECKGPSGENPIERGKRVRCAITPNKPYKVVSRRAAGDGFTNSSLPDSSFAANVPYVWQGPAVTDTRVRMVLEVTNDNGSTDTKTYNAEYQVQARSWPKLQVNPPTVAVGLRDMQPYPPADGKGVLGNAQTELDTAKVLALPLSLVQSGPNAGLIFVRDPWPAFNFSIQLHPALYDDPANPTQPWQVWHADQNGVGSGTCTQAVFGILEPAVRRHEGATQVANSHWGIARDFFQSSNVEQDLEKIYRRTTDPNVVLQAGVNRLRTVIRNNLTPLQEAFDATDTPALIASLGCTLDHRRNDP
ncbi:MAG TPA: hypothetical protein VF710_17510 [Longimicrobium sp.]